MIFSDNTFLLTIMLAYFVIVGPWLGYRDLAALRRLPAAALPAARCRTYSRAMIFEWSITAVLLSWWLLLGHSTGEIGLHIQVSGWQWLALAVSVVATVLFSLYSWRAAASSGDLAEVLDQIGNLTLVVPHTRAELRRFGWLSVTAGICEEILYRGLLMTALAAVIGLWPAVVVSSLVFGLGHAYQGLAGILRTSAIGLVLAMVVVLTGSLPFAMVIHAVIDLVQGRLLWTAVNTPRSRSQVASAPEPHGV
jgi:membrane protease YdiL (CAAX protease family)